MRRSALVMTIEVILGMFLALSVPTPVSHAKRSAIVAIRDESKPVVKTPRFSWQSFPSDIATRK